MIEVPVACRLIILDLDGTLVRMPVDWAGMKAALAERFPETSFAQLTGGLRDVERRHGAEGRARCFEVIRRFERDNLEGTRPVDAMRALVSEHGGRTLLAVCSNNLHATIEDVLDSVGVREHFAILVGRDDVAECKPSPEGLFRILRALQVRAQDAIFIGNHESDAEAGARAGIRTIVISP